MFGKLNLPTATSLSVQDMTTLLAEMYYREGCFDASEGVARAVECTTGGIVALYMLRRVYWIAMGWDQP